MSARIRVLVVDDSALMRKLIPAVLARDPSIEVVGTAMDGAFALKKIEELHPDVVTLDLEMPRMDGMETLRLIMRRAPMPVVLFSTHSKEGGYATLKALALGAIDFVQKPQDAAAGHLESVADQLIEKIKVAKRAAGRKLPAAVVSDDPPKGKKKNHSVLPPNRIIAIGISTGGPNALQYVLSQIPADFPASILIVQHMPEGFTEMFAKRLDECCAHRGAGSALRRSSRCRPRPDLPRQSSHYGSPHASRRHGRSYPTARPSMVIAHRPTFSFIPSPSNLAPPRLAC